jgi:hypothetical protein
MDKENMANVYHEIVLSHKENEIMSFAGKDTGLDVNMLREIAQAQKAEYCMFLLIGEF